MGGGPAWKREVVPDHKFDFVDVRDFTDNSFGTRLRYLWLYLVVLKDFLVYVSDIFTAITMLSSAKSLSATLTAQCRAINGCITVPFHVTQYLFVGCIIFSFLLLAYESRKAKKIIASRDISYAFTNVMANNYYSLRSYDHFCFFNHISNSTKKKDDLALFVFFTFKTWKRVLLADGPRQAINGLTLWAIFLSKESDPRGWYYIPKYFPDGQKLAVSALTVTTFFTVLVFIGSLGLLILAAVIYIPLLCYIQGNLKEYVCHKVDKRISQIIKRRNKERLAKAAAQAKKEAMGDFSHLRNKKGELIGQPLPQPTLPNVSLDDDLDTTKYAPEPPSSLHTQDSYYTDKDLEYPPMPAYYPGGHWTNPSQGTLDPYSSHEQESLTNGAAPFARQPSTERHGAYPPPTLQTSYIVDDVYGGLAGPSPAPVQPQAVTTDHVPNPSNSAAQRWQGNGPAYQ